MNCSVLWKNVLGDVFSVNCDVRQGILLSPILFSIYVDDLVDLLRRSGFGIFIGKLFLGSILYADDILLLSSSCHGLQCMLNICIEFGRKWDIRFNSAKTKCVSFGGSDPKHFTPIIDAKCLSWCPKLKYLGCISKCGSCEIDVSPAVGKIYAQFNNIMAVLTTKYSCTLN